MKMRDRIQYIILFLLIAVPGISKAQWNFDIPVVEAYINDHKKQRSLLLARSTLEMSNRLLHEYSSEAAVGYKELNVDLDRYTRAFDIIDVLYQSLRTSLNAYSTYNTFSDRIRDYRTMLDTYHERVLKRNRIELSDTIIVTVNLHCIQRIAKEGEGIYRSLGDLILYATGAASCSSADLLTVLEDINIGLDNIEKHLNKAYFETWRYIQLRTGYWKKSVYRSRTKLQIVDDAFGRWRESGLNPYNKK